MALGFGLFALVGLAGFVLWIWVLVDALQRPDAEWEQAGQTKLLWVLLIVFVAFLGSILYLTIARPQLEDARRGF